MNDKKRPKLHWPLALLAAPAGPKQPRYELRRLVAAMVD
jgi:hypothetical protein